MPVAVRAFSSIELASMRTTQDSAMQDVCRIGEYREVLDAYGNPDTNAPSSLWVYGDEVACGLEMVRPRETQESGDVPLVDARLRLALDTAIDEVDRIRMEQRYGEAMDPAEVYEVAGPPRRGPSGLVVEMRLLADGTGRPYE
jgi:hypothetical protein